MTDVINTGATVALRMAGSLAIVVPFAIAVIDAAPALTERAFSWGMALCTAFLCGAAAWVCRAGQQRRGGHAETKDHRCEPRQPPVYPAGRKRRLPERRRGRDPAASRSAARTRRNPRSSLWPGNWRSSAPLSYDPTFNAHGWYVLVWDELGVQLNECADETVRAISNSDAFKAMPNYPADGCIQTIDGVVKGGAAGHLLRYAVPLMLGNWFQLAYNAVDSIIAGRFIGKDALAAEGIAGPVMNLVILGITGVCLGAGVLMSEFFGAKDGESLRRELATTVLSGTAACTVVALLGVLFTPAILQACAVPREIFAITAIYLRITFLGAPFTCFYNALAAGFKSVGDARTPLRFLMVSAILNAALDLIFIGGLGFGIVCSAMTTVIAEAFSAVLAGWWLWTKTPELCPRRGQWRVDRSLLGRTLQYGGVSALQQAVQPIGKVLIQGQVNALGVEVIAAFNAVTRIDDFACIPEQSIAQGITTYIAQNRGAGRQDRIGCSSSRARSTGKRPKAAGIDFAIIRCGFGGEWDGQEENWAQDDTQWRATPTNAPGWASRSARTFIPTPRRWRRPAARPTTSRGCWA